MTLTAHEYNQNPIAINTMLLHHKARVKSRQQQEKEEEEAFK